MIQHSHFWVCIQWKLNHYLEEIFVLQCSLQHYSQQPRYRNYLSLGDWVKKMWCVHMCMGVYTGTVVIQSF